MFEILQYEFMRNALLAAVLVSVACGIMGTFIVAKRIVFISGGISHAAFGGIGIGYFLGVNPVVMAIPFALLSAIGIGILRKKMRISEDSAIGILWVIGVAIGVLFIGLTPGYAPDLFSYLFGSILTVPIANIIIMILLDVVMLGVVLVLFREFQALCFDEEFAEITGVPTKSLYLLLLSLVALSIIVLIRVVGIILVMALLTLPAAIGRQFTSRLKNLVILSISTAVVFTVLGLWLSYIFDLPSGATIVLVLAIAFFVSIPARKLRTRIPIS